MYVVKGKHCWRNGLCTVLRTVKNTKKYYLMTYLKKLKKVRIYLNFITAMFVMCTFRVRASSSAFWLLTVLSLNSNVFFSGDLLVNPEQPRHTIPIAQIAPDLILADLPRNIMLNTDELEFDKAPEFLLGKHYFEGLFRRAYIGKSVEISSAMYERQLRDFSSAEMFFLRCTEFQAIQFWIFH